MRIGDGDDDISWYDDDLCMADYDTYYCWTLVCYIAPVDTTTTLKDLKYTYYNGIASEKVYGTDYNRL
jgi:hypothetical protein